MSDTLGRLDALKSLSAAAKRAYEHLEQPAVPMGFAVPPSKPRIRVPAVMRK